MSKAFTKEDDGAALPAFRSRFAPVPVGQRNLITPAGAARLKAELAELRAELARTSGVPETQQKLRRLTADDLARRLETLEVVEPAAASRVGFGSTVEVRDGEGETKLYVVVGLDEIDAASGRVSWTSPLGRALRDRRVGDVVRLETPKGEIDLEVLRIS